MRTHGPTGTDAESAMCPAAPLLLATVLPEETVLHGLRAEIIAERAVTGTFEID